MHYYKTTLDSSISIHHKFSQLVLITYVKFSHYFLLIKHNFWQCNPTNSKHSAIKYEQVKLVEFGYIILGMSRFLCTCANGRQFIQAICFVLQYLFVDTTWANLGGYTTKKRILHVPLMLINVTKQMLEVLRSQAH